jgi:hypothetical protein
LTRQQRAPLLAGVEREWRVLRRSGAVQDFRSIVDALPLDGRRLDPDDPHAHRCRWGGVVTADGAEAEVATPPVPVGPGAAADLDALARLGFVRLRAALPKALRLNGYSTHINVTVPDRMAVRVAERFARRLAIPQMLLLDRADSPGLLVRPRRGRLEIGGEYASAEQLQSAVVFAMVGAVACAQFPTLLKQVPRASLRLERANGRFGWYVDRCAAGVDLYRDGRQAAVPTNAGVMPAGGLLQETWALLRPLATELVGDVDAGLVDDFVAGRRPLPMEQPACDPRPEPQAVPAAAIHGRVIDDVVRPGFVVRTVAARWDRIAFEVDDGRRRRFVVVPAARLASFLAAVDDGEYDGRLTGWIARPTRRPA